VTRPDGTSESESLDFESVGDSKVEIAAGDPEQVLVERCQEDPEKSLCLIGATGHTRTLKEIILGTTSFHLIHKLRGPVLLAR
jgi:nucleotide-binding universal stress UspA family protein